jgi:hypothetical protein
MSREHLTGDEAGWNRGKVLLYALVVLGFSLLVFGFSVGLPFMCDDFCGFSSVTGDRYYPAKDKIFYNIYDYIDPHVKRIYPQALPWWTSLDMKLLFLRPLPSITLKWEVDFWGKNPAPLHLTNVVLFGMAAVFLFLLGRQLFRSDEVGLLSALIFATHLCNSFVVPWVAERASVLSMFFGVGGLALHVGFRRSGRRRWEFLAWLCFILSFLSRESGAICLITYFLYDLLVWRKEAPQKWPGFFRLVFTYALLCIPLGVFVIYFVASGYGVHGYYSIIDGKTPLLQVSIYLAKNVFLYAFGLLYFALIGHDKNIELFQNPLYATLFFIMVACTAVLFYPGVRKKLFKDPAFQFLGSWILIALLPIIYLLTQNRYQFPATAPFGLFMGGYIVALWRARGFGRFTKAMVGFLVFFYVVFPPLLVGIKGYRPYLEGVLPDKLARRINPTFQNVFNAQTILVRETQALLGDAEPPVDVYFINVPSPLYVMALQFAFDYYLGKGTTRVFPLTMRPELPEVEVKGDRSIVISSRDHPFLEDVGDRVFMSTTEPVNEEGHTWTNEYFQARVEKLVDGRIHAIRFDFAKPIQDKSVRFFYVNRQDRHVYPYSFAPAVQVEGGT